MGQVPAATQLRGSPPDRPLAFGQGVDPQWLRVRTADLLVNPNVEPVIDAIADALIEKGTLSAKRIREIRRESLKAYCEQAS